MSKNPSDEAFKDMRKEILTPYLKVHGFSLYKTNAYVRRNSGDILEYLDLQKERYGARTMAVNFAIQPLYVPGEKWLNTGFGGRLAGLAYGKDLWLDYHNEKQAKRSFNEIKHLAEVNLFPWFELMREEKNYLGDLRQGDRNWEGNVFSSCVGNRRIDWITCYYLYQGRQQEAQAYLEEKEKDLQYNKKEYWYDNAMQRLERMKELCVEAAGEKGVLYGFMAENAAKWKLPKAVFSSTEKELRV